MFSYFSPLNKSLRSYIHVTKPTVWQEHRVPSWLHGDKNTFKSYRWLWGQREKKMHSLTEMHVYNLRQAFFSSYILEKKWDYVASGVIFFFFSFQPNWVWSIFNKFVTACSEVLGSGWSLSGLRQWLFCASPPLKSSAFPNASPTWNRAKPWAVRVQGSYTCKLKCWHIQ